MRRFCIKSLALLISIIISLCFFLNTSYPVLAQQTVPFQESLPFFLPPLPPESHQTIPLKGVRFVTEEHFPPFSFRTPSGELAGFHIDLAREICLKKKLFCSLRVLPFNKIIPVIRAGEADVAIAGIAITAQNREILSFTLPYLPLPARFVMRRDKEAPRAPARETASDFAGARIAIRAQSPYENFIRRFFPESFHIPYETFQDATEALRNGDVDVFFDSALTLSSWLQGEASQKCCQFYGLPWYNAAFFGHGFALATQKTNPELAQVLTYTLRDLMVSGRFQELFLRYFPENFYEEGGG